MSTKNHPLSFIDNRFGSGIRVRPEFAQYSNNGALALRLVVDGDQKDSFDSEPWGHPSVNLPGDLNESLERGEVAIKNWSENAGLADLMVQSGLLMASEKVIDNIPVHQLTEAAMKLAEPTLDLVDAFKESSEASKQTTSSKSRHRP